MKDKTQFCPKCGGYQSIDCHCTLCGEYFTPILKENEMTASAPNYWEAQVIYTPVWINASGQIGSGFPCKSQQECDEIFKERVRNGLKDKLYQIKVTTTTFGFSRVLPLGSDKKVYRGV